MPSTTHYGPSLDYDSMTFDDLVALDLAVGMALTRRMASSLSVQGLAKINARQVEGWRIGVETTCTATGRASLMLIGVAPDGLQREQFADMAEPPPASTAH
jgi:hypothetical protein